jgi:hypothetical protein
MSAVSLALSFALFLLLLLALGFVLWRGAPTSGGVRAWRPLSGNRADLERTLQVLAMAMLIFGLAASAWAGAAGVMRTAWLYGARPDGIAQALSGWACLAADCSGWLVWAFLVFQVLRAVGGVLVIAFAAGLAGSLIGFLFGIPREVSAAEPAAPAGAPPRQAASATATPAAEQRRAAGAWQLSTNLTQVSDWLTKIIVGVGLVELKNGWAAFSALSDAAAGWLFEMRHGSPALIPSAMIGAAVLGFLYAYIYTFLVISPLIAAIGLALNRSDRVGGILSYTPGPGLSGPVIPPSEEPTQEEMRQALTYAAIRFDDLVATPGVTTAAILNWARAKTILGDYDAAAQAYEHLLGMRLR